MQKKKKKKSLNAKRKESPIWHTNKDFYVTYVKNPKNLTRLNLFIKEMTKQNS